MSTLALLGGEPVNTNPLVWNSKIDGQELEACQRVLTSGVLSDFYGSPGKRFLGGQEILRFEKSWSEFFKVKHSVSCNSATSGLHMAIGALRLGPGDEVIVPPWTMSATVMAVLMHGATPVFADIEKDYFTIDPVDIEKKITPKTKAIFAVNLFGQACDFRKLKSLCEKHKLYLLEDNAQGPGGDFEGQPLGTIADIGVYSLNCHKAIQCGEGGVAVTNDDELALRMQLIRNHGEAVVPGMPEDTNHDIVGFNFRMTEINAAIAEVQLSKLNSINQYKIELYQTLQDKLAKFSFLRFPKRREKSKHVFYLDPVLYDKNELGLERSRFIQALNAEGFKCVGGYVNPLYRLPIFKNKTRQASPYSYALGSLSENLNYETVSCPVTESYHQESFFYMDMVRHKVDNAMVEKFVLAIEKVATNAEKLKL